jgi:hypothetical protein
MPNAKKQQHAKTPKTSSVAVFPKELEAALGPKPVLPFEDASLYETLQTQVLTAIQPTDAIEFLDVRAFIDITWSIIRVRRHMNSLMKQKLWENIKSALLPRYEAKWVHDQKTWFFAGDKGAIKDLSECLSKISSSIEEIEVMTFSQLSVRLQSLEMLLANYEARRMLLYRELEKRRDLLARRLREQAPVIEAKLIAHPDVNNPRSEERPGGSSETA